MDVSKIIKLTVAGIIAILLTGMILYVKLQRDRAGDDNKQTEVFEKRNSEETAEKQLEELDKIREQTQKDSTGTQTEAVVDPSAQLQELDKLRDEAGTKPPTQQEMDDQLKALDALKNQ